MQRLAGTEGNLPAHASRQVALGPSRRVSLHRIRCDATRATSGGLPTSGIILTLCLAALVRLALAPLTQGHDFVVWDDASRLLMRGVNPYTHWRDMPNAYPYLPVFLYMLLPLQWLALHTALPFTLLGKLPVVLADLAVGATLYGWLLNAGRSPRSALAAACLYLFNPLVLYNGAFLGRFDAVALAFLLPALMADGPRFAILYGLAVATKTFPIFILPALMLGRYRRAPSELVGAAAVILVIALPFLLWDPRALLYNLTLRAANVVPIPLGLSWHTVLLRVVSPAMYAELLHVFLLLFMVAVVLWRGRPPLTLCALTFSAFLLIDHKVWEQYLTWPLPFLIALALLRRDLGAGLLAAGLSVAALFDNYQGAGPVDRRFYIYLRLLPHPTVTVNVLLALGIMLYIVWAWRLRQPWGDRAELRALRRTARRASRWPAPSHGLARASIDHERGRLRKGMEME